jgi:hypothetical protein
MELCRAGARGLERLHCVWLQSCDTTPRRSERDAFATGGARSWPRFGDSPTTETLSRSGAEGLRPVSSSLAPPSTEKAKSRERG